MSHFVSSLSRACCCKTTGPFSERTASFSWLLNIRLSLFSGMDGTLRTCLLGTCLTVKNGRILSIMSLMTIWTTCLWIWTTCMWVKMMKLIHWRDWKCWWVLWNLTTTTRTNGLWMRQIWLWRGLTRELGGRCSLLMHLLALCLWAGFLDEECRSFLKRTSCFLVEGWLTDHENNSRGTRNRTRRHNRAGICICRRAAVSIRC